MDQISLSPIDCLVLILPKDASFFRQHIFRPVRLAYQPPANSTFLSEQTSHQQPARTSQQYSSLRTNQHQPSATSQPNRLFLSTRSKSESQGNQTSLSKPLHPQTSSLPPLQFGPLPFLPSGVLAGSGRESYRVDPLVFLP
jgi:hypothetical protein